MGGGTRQNVGRQPLPYGRVSDRRSWLGLISRLGVLISGFGMLACFSCMGSNPISGPTVGELWQRPRAIEPKSNHETTEAFVGASKPSGVTSAADTIATVNGQPISRASAVDLLLQSHGPALLEQIVVLTAAEREAAEKGLSVTPADIDRELDLALRQLINPQLPVAPLEFDRGAAERVLDAVLDERNISRAEFMIGMRRNACLRKLVEAEQRTDAEDLRAEYERTYGARVQIRHIQLATLADVARAKDRLAAGMDFAEAARHFSANTASAPRGGLLEPFSAGDEEVPPALREAAFRLSPGEVSSAIRVGEWYHLLKFETSLPAEYPPLTNVRAELEVKLRERSAGPAMQQLYERLFREADVRVHDPVLKAAFEAKRSNLNR